MADEPPFIPPRPSLDDLLRGTEFEHWLAPPERADEPPLDSLTIVVHLPQPLGRVNGLLAAIGELWPGAAFTDGLARLEIPADE